MCIVVYLQSVQSSVCTKCSVQGTSTVGSMYSAECAVSVVKVSNSSGNRGAPVSLEKTLRLTVITCMSNIKCSDAKCPVSKCQYIIMSRCQDLKIRPGKRIFAQVLMENI